jgi:hypothetical protein
MTNEELAAAGLPLDPVAEGAEHAALPKILALPAAPEVAKMGRFSLTAAKTSEEWMPVSTI